MKKLSWFICLMAMLVVVPVSSAFAESTVSYDSDASVGFYGEYVYPDESTPEITSPENPTEVEESDGVNPSTGGSGLTSSSGVTSENGTTAPTLPQTGDVVSSQTTLIGVLLISFSFMLIYKRKTKTI